MKKYISSIVFGIIFICFLIFFVVTSVFSNSVDTLQRDRSFQINNYDIVMDVNEDNTYDITETITVKFNENNKHGIYRNLPEINSVVTEENGKVKTTNYRIKYTDVKATQLYNQYYENNNLVLMLGSGNYTYKKGDIETFIIRYKVNIGDDRNKKYDQFYYNVLGNNWTCDITSFKATIHFFKDVTDTEYYVYYKENADKLSINGSSILITENNIEYGTPITVRAVFENGFYSKAKADNLIYFALFGVIILFAVISLFIYLKKSNKKLVVPVVEFKAPEGLSPAECGYIIDHFVDDKDIASLIVYFANKKYLKIDATDEKNIYLEKLQEMEGGKKYEKKIFDKIFKDENRVKLSEVGLQISSAIETAKNQIKKENEKKYFKNSLAIYFSIILLPLLILIGFAFYINYKQVAMGLNLILNILGTVLIAIFSIVFIFVQLKKYSILQRKVKFLNLLCLVFISVGSALYLVFATDFTVDLIFGKLFAILSVLMALYLSYKFNNRTDVGVEMVGKLIGLKQFIATAEKDRIEMLVKQEPYLFYEILPYAYVLGVSDTWIKKFKDIVVKVPDSYAFNADLVDFILLNHFVNSTMRSFNSGIQKARVKNISSGKGGFGGFSGGGGGFSGGGFGGGGGGSW